MTSPPQSPSSFHRRFDTDRPILGMVHLPPLPGAPRFDGDRTAIRERSLADAETLLEGGVDGLVLENFGDAPFYPESVPAHVVAEMTAVASDVADVVDVPLGINVLRNDAEAALAVAGATGASFVRVNVHTGSAATDQGILEGRAHETLRTRDELGLASDVAILADVHVKHATPIGEQGLERATGETVERGLADGVIVSGPGTGAETELADLDRVVETVRELERDVPVLVGSGVTPESVGEVFERGADGAIVGTAFKRDGQPANSVALERVRELVRATETG
ncbi:BtpA/SgcQ family protein [Halobacteria archaeon AArc-m2/3/4]|uniref:BtpA/SgcQ family protein n=1 Tax=Natronoglomus mannanivorans TaxID=2979990 RepID=A0ABT2QL40_9EURY|nr:BtpA/SgcQ family protein [Halobacteria archaeon AArc-m2/3/4]